jgi:hypothetical protein
MLMLVDWLTPFDYTGALATNDSRGRQAAAELALL